MIKKLSLTINSYDTGELLEPVITQIRDKVDHVACIYQKLSYWRNPIDEEDMEELVRLKSIGLVNELIEFKPDFMKYSREQECDKRNMGIRKMKENGSSHVLNIDADEMYDTAQFQAAKDLINKNSWNITYCQYINYYRDLDHYLIFPFESFVPFIHSTFFNYTYNASAPGPTDPTRRIHNPFGLSQHVFKNDVVMMNHLAWVRKDIRKKLKNWSANNHFTDVQIEAAINKWENWKEGEPAVLLFNTPENKVNVKKLEKRWINVKIPWVEEEVKRWKG